MSSSTEYSYKVGDVVEFLKYETEPLATRFAEITRLIANFGTIEIQMRNGIKWCVSKHYIRPFNQFNELSEAVAL